MATDTQDYEGVDTGEEEAWNPKKPQASALSDYVGADPAMPHSKQMEAPAVESAPLGAAPPIAQVGDKQPALPQRPQSPTKEAYAAVQPHGWKKALAATFAGMGAFESPEAGQQIYDREFGAPQRKLTQQSKEQQSDYDTELKQGQDQQAAQRAAATIAVRGPNGETAYIPQKDYEKYLQNQNTVKGAGERTTQTNESKENIAGAGNETKEDIAGKGNESKEKIEGMKIGSAKEIANLNNRAKELIAQGNQEVQHEKTHATGTKADPLVRSSYGDYQGAISQLNKMQESVNPALNGDQQAMVNILMNHVGMTLGQQKGARMNQAVIKEAEDSAPWLGRIAASFDDRGILSGVTLTPEQIHQMVALGVSSLSQAKRKFEETRDAINTGVLTQTPETKLGAPAPPKVGEIIDGHKFLGGDPRDKASWEKAAK